MGYGELLRALEDEVRAEARKVREEAARERERVLDEARRAAAMAREEALVRLAAELAARRARAEAAASLEPERHVLSEQRRLLDELRASATERLAAASGPALTARLLDEIAPEVGEGPVAVEVDPGGEDAIREHLARAHPAIAARAAVRTGPGARGGVLVEVDGRAVLDNTLSARLERAWSVLEGEAAGRLFAALEPREEAHGAV